MHNNNQLNFHKVKHLFAKFCKLMIKAFNFAFEDADKVEIIIACRHAKVDLSWDLKGF